MQFARSRIQFSLILNVDFDVSEVDLDENNCDSMKRPKTPEKKSITASVGSYASVLKGREKNKMSGNQSEIALLLL